MKTNVSMSWIIGLAVIIIAFVVLLLFLVVMPKFKVLQNLVDKLNLVTREILTGLPVIRAFSTEKHEEERFDDANRTLTKTNLFVNRAMTFMMPVMMLVMNGVSAVSYTHLDVYKRQLFCISGKYFPDIQKIFRPGSAQIRKNTRCCFT